MASSTPKSKKASKRGGINVSRSGIRQLARQIADQFQPQKIILFGSFAYGQPTPDSDVDLLVVMPTRNMTSQACRIRMAVEPDFPLDLVVRTPEYLRQRLADGDWFLREIIERGKVLYEEVDRRVGAKGRSGRQNRQATRKSKAARE